MKYVIVEKMGSEVPILFPDFINHDTFIHMRPISAGKVKIIYDKNIENKYGDYGEINYHVFGESTSLKLHCRPEDEDIIKHAFEFEGG